MTKNTRLIFLAAGVLGFVVQTARAEDVDSIFSSPAPKEVPNAAATSLVKSSIDWKSFIPTKTPEQNIFVSFLNANDYERALYQWGDSYQKDAFGKSDAGKALYGYILWKNGLRINGVEQLFNADNPTKIPGELAKAWKTEAPSTDPVWSKALVKWTPGWTQIFDEGTEVRVRARQITADTPVAAVEDIVKKAKAGTPEKSWAEWELALAYAQKGDTAASAKILKALMERPGVPVGQDHIQITAARLLYERGFLDNAIQYYEKVSKGSELWFDAQEEIAWAYLRKGEPQNSIGVVHGLVVPAFAPVVGPETIYLKSVAHLKVCDYPVVVDTLKDYKDRFRPRTEALKTLGETGNSQASEDLVNRMKTATVNWRDLGSNANKLPRYSTRDQVLRNLVALYQTLETESAAADQLYARSLSGGTEKIGFRAFLGEFKQGAEKRAALARSAVYNRVAQLAREEVEEISQILQKLHIVEAEVIQQTQLAKKVTAAGAGSENTREGRVRANGEDQIKFPHDGEIWLDELSNYKVDLKKGCQGRKKGV